MTFTYKNVIDSIANQLANLFPDGDGGCLYPIRQSPTEDTEYPCFFIFIMNPSIENEPSDMHRRETGFDIVYVQQRNIPDQNENILTVLKTLDEGMDMLDYSDGKDTVKLHFLERNATIEDQELHYKVTMKQRVYLPREQNYMQVMEENNVEIKGD